MFPIPATPRPNHDFTSKMPRNGCCAQRRRVIVAMCRSLPQRLRKMEPAYTNHHAADGRPTHPVNGQLQESILGRNTPRRSAALRARPPTGADHAAQQPFRTDKDRMRRNREQRTQAENVSACGAGCLRSPTPPESSCAVSISKQQAAQTASSKPQPPVTQKVADIPAAAPATSSVFSLHAGQVEKLRDHRP